VCQIGFAKFRSQVEALEARDILTGRKVDAEKGCILKAEMAKKNLHTKRGLSIDYASTNNYSYTTHVSHYQRRYMASSPGTQAPPLYSNMLMSSTPPAATQPRPVSFPSSLPSSLPSNLGMADYYQLVGKDAYFPPHDFKDYDEPDEPLDFLLKTDRFPLPPVGFNRQTQASSSATLVPQASFGWNAMGTGFSRSQDM